MPIQTAIDSISNSQGSPFGFKNRIINGAMVIDQRNGGSSFTANNTYSVDRWLAVSDTSNKWTIQQNAGSVTPPTGFTNYLGCTSSSAYTPISTDYFGPQQRIEGYNIADLDWGTANAKTITLSFWVRSSLTGSFGGSIQNSSQNRSYAFPYTISSANTWEYKTITITGDTSGTWLTTSGIGFVVHFSLGAGSSRVGTANAWTGTSNVFAPTGSVNVVGTNGATFYITGVQLEKGSTATSFDYRPYVTEVALCQRYFEKTYDLTTAPGTNTASSRWWFNGSNDNGGNGYFPIYFKVIKRADPTITFYQTGGTAGSWNYHSAATGSTTGTAGVSSSGTGNMTCYTLAAGGAHLGMFTFGHWTASSEI